MAAPCPAPPYQSAMEGLQLSLSFEEEDGSVTADSSGMNYNAALKAPASRTDSGKHGRGLRLSGSASEAVICRDDIQGPWTVSLWVNRKEGSDGGPLLWSYRGAIGVVQGETPADRPRHSGLLLPDHPPRRLLSKPHPDLRRLLHPALPGRGLSGDPGAGHPPSPDDRGVLVGGL